MTAIKNGFTAVIVIAILVVVGTFAVQHGLFDELSGSKTKPSNEEVTFIVRWQISNPSKVTYFEGTALPLVVPKHEYDHPVSGQWSRIRPFILGEVFQVDVEMTDIHDADLSHGFWYECEIDKGTKIWVGPIRKTNAYGHVLCSTSGFPPPAS